MKWPLAAVSGSPWASSSRVTGTDPSTEFSIGTTARSASPARTASSATVTVANDTAAPTVALTNPGAGATVSGTVTIDATASDDLAVVGVQFALDGEPLGTEATTAPYELTWATTSVANGAHTVTAVARDGAGHVTATSAAVTVANETEGP